MTYLDYRAALCAAEDELRRLRAFKAAVAAFIHDPTRDLEARRCLAQRLGLPAPRTTASPATRIEEPHDDHRH